MTHSNLLVAAVSALVLSAAAVGATTIHVTDFSAAAHSDVSDGGSFVGEDFESEGNALGEVEVGLSLLTDVGEFYSLGGTGSGGTVSGLAGNTGDELALRDGNTYGRNDTVGGRWYLDSNDTWGIGWEVETGSMFDTIAFVLTDGSDTGAYLRITIDGVSYEQRTGGSLSNGNSELVVISLGGLVSSAYVEIANYKSDGTTLRTNDGFSIDGAQVGIAAVPLPAALPMLAAGIGAMVVLRRRRQRAG